MNLKKAINGLTRVVLAEADRNPDFANRLEQAFSAALSARESPEAEMARESLGADDVYAAESHGDDRRPKNRRPPAVLDPIEVAKEGESALRWRLGALSVEQLKDVVADYGLDPSKLAMKWKTADRLIERIVEVSMGRMRKGDVFRGVKDADENSSR